MYQQRTRREFLRESIAAAAIGTVGAVARAAPKDASGRTVWPIASRDVFLRDAGEQDIWTAMKAIGIEGAEVTVKRDLSLPHMFAPGKTYSIATADAIKQLGEALGRARRKISAFCLLNRYDEHPDKEIDWTVRTARAAADLGVPVVRIDLVQSKIKAREAFAEFSIKVGRTIVEATRNLPVRFGVENHGGTTNRPEFLRKVFDGIGTKRFGITLDVGNFYWFGHPLSKLYDIYTEFAPWACHFHAKSIRYPVADRERQREMGWKYGQYRCPIYEGDIDYDRVGAILRKSGYSGALCIDDESIRTFPKPQRREILKKDAEFLRRLARAG
jgi:sugar phosphate isomerase/epimerase